MGAYQIWNIEFKSTKDRDNFEKIIPRVMAFKLKRLFQYNLAEISKGLDVTYYAGWLGYAEGYEAIKLCKKKKIRLLKFLSVDLSCQSPWYNELKQVSYKDKLKGGSIKK
jgi:uncharacterized protein YjaZ